MGTVFGGVILSHLDLAGAEEARRHTAGRVVTKAMREVEFVAPVHLGDLVSIYVKTVARGRTSVTVEVRVDAQRTGPTGNRDTVHRHLGDSRVRRGRWLRHASFARRSAGRLRPPSPTGLRPPPECIG